MAIGFGRLIGFNVTKNFDYPYFSENIAEFWRKWHISLTSWMTEYVFNPLAFIFRDYGKLGLILAILINFILIGLWHGANWTFVLFGLLHGLYFIPLILSGKLNNNNNKIKNKTFPSLKESIKMLVNFTLVMLTMIVFRSESIGASYQIFIKIFSKTVFTIPDFRGKILALIITIFITIFFIIEWLGKEDQYAIEKLLLKRKRPFRWFLYYAIIFAILWFSGEKQEFSYFQF